MRYLPSVLWCLGMVLVVSSAQGQTPVAATAEEEPNSDSAKPIDTSAAAILLAETESTLLPPNPKDLILLSEHLHSRGLDRVADSIRAKISTHALVEWLLKVDEADAALAVLQQWKASEPDSPDAALLEAIVRFSSNDLTSAFELTVGLDRRLNNVDDAALARLLRGLIQDQSASGLPSGPDNNPWQARWVDETGQFSAGLVIDVERKKVPPETIGALVRFLRLRPRAGWAWALLGELTNAEGDVPTARKCFERAKYLKFSPANDPGRMQSRLDVIDEYLKEQQGQLSELAAPSESARPEGGWSNLIDRPQALVVIGLGILMISLIGGLQVRQWRKSRSRR